MIYGIYINAEISKKFAIKRATIVIKTILINDIVKDSIFN